MNMNKMTKGERMNMNKMTKGERMNMNKYSRELCHAGVKKGFERKNHKYIARIEGNKPGSYRYFYTTAAYEAWKRAKGGIKEGVNLWKSGARDLRKVSDKISSDIQTFKKYNEFQKKLRKGPVRTGPEHAKLIEDLGNTYLYRAGEALMKLQTPKVVQKVVKFIDSQSGKIIPKTYSDEKKQWTQIDSKTGEKTEHTSITKGIEWLNTKFPLLYDRTSIKVYQL